MLATLNRPIVTDYIPAGKNPWVLLALLVCVFVVGLSDQYLAAGLALVGVVCLVCCGRRSEPPDDGTPEESRDVLAVV